MDKVAYPYRDAPDRPGVYVITLGSEVLYVGRSSSLRRRLKGHDKILAFRQLGMDIEVAIETCDNADWREKQLIAELNPRCNSVRPNPFPQSPPVRDTGSEGSVRRLIHDVQSLLGCNQTQLASLLGLSQRTITGWATGRRPLPRIAQMVLQMIVEGRITEQDLAIMEEEGICNGPLVRLRSMAPPDADPFAHQQEAE